MKPVQVGVLVLAGAVGGVLAMKVFERPQPAAPAPVAAQAPVSAPQAPQAVEPPAPVERPVENPAHNKVRPKPKPIRQAEPQNPEPVAVAQNAPAPAPVAAPAPPVAAEVPPPAAPRETEPAPPAPPPPPSQVTLNAGTTIPVRLVDGLSTERNHAGDLFAGTLDQPLIVDGLVIAERGARVEGRVATSDRGGRVSGVAELSVELTRIHLSDGQTISVQTESFRKQAEASKKEDAAKVGGGAAIGAIIGAIAGGGKGAAIGAGVGGGAGAGDVALTRGKPAALPSETRLTFRLSAPITVTERH